MNRKTILVALASLGLAVLAWDLLRAPAPATAPAAVAAAPAPAPAASRPSGSVAANAPAGPAASANILRSPTAIKVTATPLAQEFASATSYRPLYDRLKGTPEGATPEGQYLLWQMLRACGNANARKGQATHLDELRTRVAADHPETDPRRAQRIAAIDRLATDKCAGMGGITATEAELSALLKGAAAGNDPKARVTVLEQEMWAERRAAGGRAGPTLSDGQLDAIRDAFSSRDPEAMVSAGRILANNFRDLSVRIGPDQQPIEPNSFRQAALLLACEYGYSCGDNAVQVLQGCASQGRCDANSLPDYLFYYGVSPYDAQVLDRYRTMLRTAVDTGDFSSLSFQRGVRTNTPIPTPPGGR